MHKANFPLQTTQKVLQEEQSIVPIVDFLKAIRNDLHEDLLKQQSFTDFLKDLPNFFDKVAEEVGKKTELIESLQRDLRDYTSIKGKFQDFEKRLQTYDGLMKDKDQEIGSLKNTNNDLFNENDNLNKKNRELEYKISDLNTRCEELARETKKEQDSTVKLKKEHERTAAELQQRFEHNKKDLEDGHKKSISELEKTIKDITEENEELRQKIQGYQDEFKKLSKLQMEKKTLQEDHDKLTRTHDEYKKKMLKDTLDLQNDLVESERVIEHQRKVIEDLKHELQEAEAEYEDVDRALKEKETQAAERGAKLKKLGAEVQQMMQKIVDMNKLSDRLIQENETLKRELQGTGRSTHQRNYPENARYSQTQQYPSQNISVNWQ